MIPSGSRPFADSRIAEQRAGYPEPLGHPQRERPGQPLCHVAQSDDLEHLVDPAGGNAVGLGESEQVAIGAAPGVGGGGFQGAADVEQRPAHRPVGDAVEDRGAARGCLQAEHELHGGGLACPVRPEEAGDLSRRDAEAQPVHRECRPVVLGEFPDLDHATVPGMVTMSCPWRGGVIRGSRDGAAGWVPGPPVSRTDHGVPDHGGGSGYGRGPGRRRASGVVMRVGFS
jgi:hypothetical protein